jgi:ubiquinone/menaquinone biosynthesis C-methylase UbiE
MASARADPVKDYNARYFDAAAAEYDSKWSIGFDAESQANVRAKLRKALGREPEGFGRSLEIGAGTGYFTLNLLASGTVGEAVATDLSQGMLDKLDASAARLGLPVHAVRCDAATLPFPDEHFDLVLGHAVLHHLPDLPAAFRELRRVLRPGGAVVFCGEPSRVGDALARVPKRAAVAAAPVWRLLMRASRRRPELESPEAAAGANGHARTAAHHGGGQHPAHHELEWLVDVHSFTPADLVGLAREAGFEQVRVRGEELASSWFGWVSRTLEGSAEADEVPALWRWYAYGGYVALRELDRRLLEPRLPPALFYNLLMSARAPSP